MGQKNNSATLTATKPEVNVTGRHVMITQAMKDYARDKILKLERFGLRIWDINVLMDIQKVQHIVKVEFKVNGFPLKSTAVSEDMYASIDGAIDKVQAQLRRYKSRLTDHHAKGHKEIEMRVQILERLNDLSDINDEIDEENARRADSTLKPHAVVQVESRTLNELSQEEAIMKMELSEDLFLVYRSEEDRKLRVIYRRNDGNYGIIETGV